MHSAIDGRGQSRYLPGRSNDEAKDGRVAKNQNGDGQDESENKEVDVVEATGGLWRVVQGAGDEQSFRSVGRPSK